MKRTTILLLQVIFLVLPFVYLLYVWPQLPAQVPMHYGGDNQPDRFGDKSEMLTTQLVLSLVGIGISALVLYVDKIDPKQKLSGDNPLTRKISWTIVGLIATLSIYTIFITVRYTPTAPQSNALSAKGIEIIVCLFFSILGNFIANVKPNYFIGVRVPWTLENPENWRRTHRLTGKLWFWGGLVLGVILLVVSSNYSIWIMLPGIFVLSLVPIVYSFLLFQKSKTTK
ncbi:MAG: SdpI family protein [Chitinophagaceae bacterium]